MLGVYQYRRVLLLFIISSPETIYSCADQFILSYTDHEEGYYMTEPVYQQCQQDEMKLAERDLHQALLAQTRNDLERYAPSFLTHTPA